jgi:hypothetical protein
MSYWIDLAELEREESLRTPYKASPPPPPQHSDRLADYKEREGTDLIWEPKFT